MIVAACDIAIGKKPTNINFKNKRFNYCYSCEPRFIEDKIITNVPRETCIKKLKEKYPEVKVVSRLKINTKISDYSQPSDSYAYCIIDVLGNDKEEILNKLEDIKKELNYEFKDIPNPI